MEPGLESINNDYEKDFSSPTRDEKLQAALALVGLGYRIEHAYIAAYNPTDDDSSAQTAGRLIQHELDTWRQIDHDGVAGPYVDFGKDGQQPFIPKSGIAYWVKHS